MDFFPRVPPAAPMAVLILLAWLLTAPARASPPLARATPPGEVPPGAAPLGAGLLFSRAAASVRSGGAVPTVTLGGSGFRVDLARVPVLVPAATFRWPLAGQPTVTRPFEPPPQPWLAGHRGVDLAGTAGEPVLAAGAGVVAFAGSVAGTPVVSVLHPDGLRTTYEPVVASVHAGQRVAAGDPLGTLAAGHPGCPIAACLHWGLKSGAVYLDPLSLLELAEVRLLPLGN